MAVLANVDKFSVFPNARFLISSTAACCNASTAATLSASAKSKYAWELIDNLYLNIVINLDLLFY